MKKEQAKVNIFYSYSHNDELLRDQLEIHLSILERKGIISQWHDRRISAGSEWESEIDSNINVAEIILLLISPDFIASDYCYGKELKSAIERHESNQSLVIPIIVRPVDWRDAPFAKLQALPKDTLAVTSWSNQDEAWKNISEGIREAVEKVSKKKLRRSETFGLRSMKHLLATEIDLIDEMFRKDEGVVTRGLPTGLSDLDGVIDGLHSSELIVVASRPGMGKTDFTLGVAAHAAIVEKRPVAYFSLNYSAQKLTRRLIASLGRLNSYRVFRGAVDDDDWPRLTSAVSILADVPLYIDESLSLTLNLLKDRLKSIKDTHGLGLVIIDSIQNLAFQSQAEGSATSSSFLTKGIKILAKEFDIPIMVTSSISSDVELRPNKRPVFRDLDDMRSLGDDADKVIFLYDDSHYDNEYRGGGIVELIIAKNSEGKIGTIRAEYLREYALFKNI